MNIDNEKHKHHLRILIAKLAADIVHPQANYRTSLLGIIQHSNELAKLDGFVPEVRP